MSATNTKIPLWRKIQRNNFTNAQNLSDFLMLDKQQASRITTRRNFPLNLPLRLAEKIEKGNLEDPILKQFIPTIEEELEIKGYTSDPVGDLQSKIDNKLLHKYHGRALLVCTSACAMHCRYCFRQNFPYEKSTETPFDSEIQLLKEDSSISEVLLSGGDPLSLSNSVLSSLITRLSEIPHLQRLRFHTRFPIGIPERIDEELIEILSRTSLQIVFVIHCNHPRELDFDNLAALNKIQKLGIPILNQSVLLKDVNNCVNTLRSLCEKLIDNGIIPYYLHQLDRVKGAAHFEVPETEGLKLIRELQKVLPGYAVPKYVREIPGESNKTPLI
ncbi:MAG: EF-P beta-lysylation protein EpmB [Chlamydiales bacterium]|jgi:EF-P beta-lysylation protein EpmB